MHSNGLDVGSWFLLGYRLTVDRTGHFVTLSDPLRFFETPPSPRSSGSKILLSELRHEATEHLAKSSTRC